MYFTSFQQNAFPILSNYQNYEVFQNFQNQMPGFMMSVPQPYSDLYQWNQLFQTQSCPMQEKPLPITHLRTTDDNSQSEVIVDISKRLETQKKKEKKTAEKDISSAKKNSQSNIINQFYSFFSCKERSSKIVRKAIQASMPSTKFQQKILLLFYNTIKAINSKRGRKYVNRTMMLNYFTPDMLMENLPEFKEKFEKIDFISMDQLCQIFRRSCQAFLKIASIPAIMTSKRITGVSKEEHFKKRRIILKAITGY